MSLCHSIGVYDACGGRRRKKTEDDLITKNTVRTTSLTNQVKSLNTQTEPSIRGLTERVLRLYPIRHIDSQKIRLEQAEPMVANEVADAVFHPLVTAEQLVITADSDIRRTRAVNALAETLQQVSSDELYHFALAADMLTTYESQNDLARFFRDCSILAAKVARKIALGINSVSTDRAFLSGLLSEVGALVCLKLDADCFQSIWDQSGGLPVRRAELEIAQYGGTTHELGSDLLTRSGLPNEVTEAVGTRVNAATKTRKPLARIAAFARTVAVELIGCSRREHERNLIGTLPKFGDYFDLNVDIELLEHPSITPFLRR